MSFKVNSPANAFAINCKNASNLQLSRLENMIDWITKRVPGFVAEGFGNAVRKGKEETKIESVTPLFGGLLVEASTKEQKQDILYVGADSKFDVAYGYAKDNVIATLNPIPGLKLNITELPVYDLSKDWNEIVNAFSKYIREEYETAKKEEPKHQAPANVVFTATYVLVNGKVMSYGAYEAIYGPVAHQKKEKKNCLGCNLIAGLMSVYGLTI